MKAPTKKPETATSGSGTCKSSLISLGPDSKRKFDFQQSELLHAIGAVTFERLGNGRFVVRYPVQGGAEFATEQEAREHFQSVARREKGYPSGYDPRARENTLDLRARKDGEFNAREVRRLVREDIGLRDFLSLCSVRMSELLQWIDDSGASEAEKTPVKQRLLRFQARARLGGSV
jgi:hypothetical protein